MKISHHIQSGYQLQPLHCWGAFILVPFVWAAIAATAPEDTAQQWFWIEGVAIPISAVWGIDAFVGRYERNELELLLSRRSARFVYITLTMPVLLSHAIAAGFLVSLVSVFVGYAGYARLFLLYGVTQLIGVVTRSRWVATSLLTIWWLFGLYYMSDWAEAEVEGAIAVFHPMRYSGGGSFRPDLDLAGLALGGLLLFASCLLVGRTPRWVR